MPSWVGVEVAHAKLTGQRETYEDRSLAMKIPSERSLWGFHAVVAVADGMGGHNAGDVAAEEAMNTVREVAGGRRGQTASFDPTSIREGARGALSQAIRLANSRIFGLAAEAEALKQMGTTLTIAGLQDDKVVIAHAGDTRAYRITQDGIEQVTQDHSWVAEQVRAGTMTAEEAQRSPMRNQITRTVGTKQKVEPDVLELDVQGDEVILLCSDGLTECLSDAEIEDIVRSSDSIDDACRRLMKTVERSEPQDNVTVAAMEIGAFFSLYGGRTRRSSRQGRAASGAGTRRSTSKGSNFYTAIIVGSAIVAAFGFGIIVRVGWHALLSDEQVQPGNHEESAVVNEDHESTPPEVHDPDAGTMSAPNPSEVSPDLAVGVEVSIEREREALVLTLLSESDSFNALTPVGTREARLSSDHRITYKFNSAKSIPPLLNGEAWLLFDGPGAPASIRWDVNSGPVGLSSGRSFTCAYHSDGRKNERKDPLLLFTFSILPTDD